MPGVLYPDVEYVAARRVLLDALEVLGPHHRSLILVGAQAIYLRVGDGDLAVAPFTSDADLAIDPRDLEDEPFLASTLEDAGFELVVRPGTWTFKPTKVQIDFLVPATLAGAGRRGARLGAHGTEVARKAAGLEAVLVDRSLIRIAALDPTDSRVFEISVAGIAALLIAKVHKIAERKDDPIRRKDKDALDILRILRFADPAQLASTLRSLSADPISLEVTRSARIFFAELFGDRSAIGSQMAVNSSGGLEDEIAIAMSCEVLAQRLLEVWSAD